MYISCLIWNILCNKHTINIMNFALLFSIFFTLNKLSSDCLNKIHSQRYILFAICCSFKGVYFIFCLQSLKCTNNVVHYKKLNIDTYFSKVEFSQVKHCLSVCKSHWHLNFSLFIFCSV